MKCKHLAIGLDFDNTLVSYDRLLAKLSAELGWATGVSGKRAIRNAIRASAQGDLGWQRLQGMIYGPRMSEADLVPGVASLLNACRDHGVKVVIISHKTEFADIDPTLTPLREAALSWMESRGFFRNFAISLDNVYFTATKADKIARIGHVGVTAFVDDLEEILADHAFPPNVDRILYHPEEGAPNGPYRVFHDIDAIRRDFFGN